MKLFKLNNSPIKFQVLAMLCRSFKVIPVSKNKYLYREFDDIEKAQRGYVIMANGGNPIEFIKSQRLKMGLAALDIAAETIADNIIINMYK